MAVNAQNRVIQIAKDFNIKSKVIIDILADRGIESKTQTILEPEQLDIVLHILTERNQINNVDDYISGAVKIIVPEAKKPVVKPAAAQTAKSATAASPAAAEAKPEVGGAKPAAAGAKPAAAGTKPAAAGAKPVAAGAKPAAAGAKPAAGGAKPAAEEAKTAAEGAKPTITAAVAPGAAGTMIGGINADSVVRKVTVDASRKEARKNAEALRNAQRAANPQRSDRQSGNQPRSGRVGGNQQKNDRPGGNSPKNDRPSGNQQSNNDRRIGNQRKNERYGSNQPRSDRQTVPAQKNTASKSESANVQSGRVNRFERFAGITPGQVTQKKSQDRDQTKKRSDRNQGRIIPIPTESRAGTDNAQPVIRNSVDTAAAVSKGRVIDTRGSSVDLSKYDERLEKFVGESKDTGSNLQKLKKQNTRDVYARSRERDKERLAIEKIRKKEAEKAKKPKLTVAIPDEISVGELASRMKMNAAAVIKQLVKLGVMANVSEIIDYDIAAIAAEELGAIVTREVVVTIEEKLFNEESEAAGVMCPRSPVVVVMGHVDHGKTSLLDAIRNANVTEGEAGGITQHIGAYRVAVGENKQELTFLDTPGHEAFTAMRARGAQATDIAILVVAADDGIMPQTVEAINHARAAGVDIIVAINKMDLPDANPDTIKQELTKYNLVPEEWGGDVICIPVSAKTKQGINDLLENVLLIAEMKELRASPDRRARGIVIEAKLDRGRGPVATLLVQNGTLRAGDILIAGTSVGRVRAMTDDRSRTVEEAGPSVPVEVIGLAEVPLSGDEFNVVEDERMARTLAGQRRDRAKEEQFRAGSNMNLDDLFSQITSGLQELNIIIKADVVGSAEAVRSSLEKLSNEEIRINVIHSAAGGVTEGDVMFAAASGAIIIGFNVRPDKAAMDSAERQSVDIRSYRVIYECIEEITAAMKGMLAPTYREVIAGRAEVRQTIHVPSVGTIAGSYVRDGKIPRNAQIRVVRDSVVIFEDKISSLRRFKDDVKEVAQGYECGIALDRFNDIKEGDILEAFIMEEIKR